MTETAYERARREAMDAATIFRDEIPVDDRWHIVSLPSPILSWGCRHPEVVEFWYWQRHPTATSRQYVLRVFGTGHPILGAENVVHRATLVVPGAPLVWQVMEWMGRPNDGAWPPAAGAVEGRLP